MDKYMDMDMEYQIRRHIVKLIAELETVTVARLVPI